MFQVELKWERARRTLRNSQRAVCTSITNACGRETRESVLPSLGVNDPDHTRYVFRSNVPLPANIRLKAY